MAEIMPPLDLTNPVQIRAYMARKGLVFNQILPYDDPERGHVDPLDEDETRVAVRMFIGRIWQACLRAEREAERSEPVDYDGPDETVPCAWPPCDRHLRRSASGDGRQWCSKEHRSMSEATADG